MRASKLGSGITEKNTNQQHWSQGKPHQDNGRLAFSKAVAAKDNENQQKTQNNPKGTPAIPPYVPSLKYNPNAVGNRLGAFHGSKQPRKWKSAQVVDILVSAKQVVGEEAVEEPETLLYSKQHAREIPLVGSNACWVNNQEGNRKHSASSITCVPRNKELQRNAKKCIEQNKQREGSQDEVRWPTDSHNTCLRSENW